MAPHPETPSIAPGPGRVEKKIKPIDTSLEEAKRRLVEEAEFIKNGGVEIEDLPEDNMAVIGGSGTGVVEESLADRLAAAQPESEAVSSEPELIRDSRPDLESDGAIARAVELEQNREVDLDYAVAVIELIEVTEDYRNAKRIIGQRLKGELREKTETMIDEINRRLQLGIGQRRKELTLAEILVMDEFKGERPKLKKLFQDAFLQSLRVEAYREEILRNQKKFRGTNDWVVRNLMRRAADPKREPLREVKINLPVGMELFLEETSEEEFQQGKNMPPVDQAVVEAINFFKEEAKVVPSEFNS